MLHVNSEQTEMFEKAIFILKKINENSIPVCIVAVFTLARTWKQISIMDKWISKCGICIPWDFIHLLKGRKVGHMQQHGRILRILY